MRYSTSFILICFNHNFSSSICYQCYLQASERIFTSTYLFLLPLIIILEGVSFFPLYLPVSFPCHRPSLLFFSFMSFFLPLFFSRPFLLLIRFSSLFFSYSVLGSTHGHEGMCQPQPTSAIPRSVH